MQLHYGQISNAEESDNISSNLTLAMQKEKKKLFILDSKSETLVVAKTRIHDGKLAHRRRIRHQ